MLNDILAKLEKEIEKMGILDVNVSAVADQVCADPGEHKLTCTSLVQKDSKANKPMLVSIWKIDGLDAPPIFHNIMLPIGEDKQKDLDNERRVKLMLEVLGLPLDKPDSDMAIGKKVWAILNKKDSDYGEQNNITRFVKSA